MNLGMQRASRFMGSQGIGEHRAFGGDVGPARIAVLLA